MNGVGFEVTNENPAVGPMKKKVLFICTHNSARSQMAEGFLNVLSGDKYEAYSAGTEPTKVDAHAVKAMAEIGIDISKYRSKRIEEFRGGNFDYVVSVRSRKRDMSLLSRRKNPSQRI